MGTAARISVSYMLALAAVVLLKLILGLTYREGGFYCAEMMWMLECVKDMQAGGHVYDNPKLHYNYGPLWMYMLYGLHWLQQFTPLAYTTFLRLWLVGLLALADVATALWMRRYMGSRAATFFYFNPASICAACFYTQIDGIALGTGLWAATTMTATGPIWRRSLGSVLLGLSLIFKHIFIFLPWWLWGGRRRPIWLYALPVLLFALSFVPYLPCCAEGVWAKVFGYDFGQPTLLYRYTLGWILPNSVQRPLFSAAMVLLPLLLWRYRQQPWQVMLCCRLAWALFIPGFFAHYPILLVVFMGLRPGWLPWLYSVLAGLYMFAHVDWMNNLQYLGLATLPAYRWYDAYIPVILTPMALLWLWLSRRHLRIALGLT